jgi:hypothetical protein
VYFHLAAGRVVEVEQVFLCYVALEDPVSGFLARFGAHAAAVFDTVLLLCVGNRVLQICTVVSRRLTNLDT